MSNKQDLDARHYQMHSQLQYTLAQDPLQMYCFQGHENILDIGCGEGKITAQLAAKVPFGQVAGIDQSSAMIALAQQTFPHSIYSNLTFHLMDAMYLKEQSRYDFVTSFSCLHWMTDQRKALINIHHALKPSGKALFLTFPRCQTFWDPIEAIADHPKWKAYFEDNPRPYHFLALEDYRKLLPEIGFKILHLESTSHLAQFKGQQGFEDYVKGWLPFLLALPPLYHTAFLKEIGIQSLNLVPVQSDGYVYHPYEKIVILVERLNNSLSN